MIDSIIDDNRIAAYVRYAGSGGEVRVVQALELLSYVMGMVSVREEGGFCYFEEGDCSAVERAIRDVKVVVRDTPVGFEPLVLKLGRVGWGNLAVECSVV